MKITKTSKDFNQQQARRIQANFNCSICPCCKETKTFEQYMNEGIFGKGIMGGLISSSHSRGFFKIKTYSVDHYICKTCGAEWDSEPYEN